MRSLDRRLSALEGQQPGVSLGRPFLWPAGHSLADALALAGLSLDDKPLFAIRLVGLNQPPCPLYERDAHLLGVRSAVVVLITLQAETLSCVRMSASMS